MTRGAAYKSERYRLAVVAIFIAVAVVTMLGQRSTLAGAEPGARLEPQQRRTTRRPSRPTVTRPTSRVDYTRFSHKTAAHVQSCDRCHKFPSKDWQQARPADAAFPDVTEFPEHASCLECHRQQFFARERPAPRICSVCHVKISPSFTERRPFPELANRESDFLIGFPHATHVDIVEASVPAKRRSERWGLTLAHFAGQTSSVQTPAAQTSEPKSCAVCHQTYLPQGTSSEEYVNKPPADLGDGFWLKRGTFKTKPVDHTTCFTCHSEDTGILPAPSNCNACHKLAPGAAGLGTDFDRTLPARMSVTDPVMLRAWSRRNSSGTYRHEGGMHPDLACTNCHEVATMNTLDRRTMRVPVTGCAVCHITATVDDGGILNYEVEKRKGNAAFQCTKCHLTLGGGAIPPGHLAAIAAQ